MPTRAEIEAVVLQATGNPDTGVVRAVIPGIVDAVDELCNPRTGVGAGDRPVRETRVVEAQETR